MRPCKEEGRWLEENKSVSKLRISISQNGYKELSNKVRFLKEQLLKREGRTSLRIKIRVTSVVITPDAILAMGEINTG